MLAAADDFAARTPTQLLLTHVHPVWHAQTLDGDEHESPAEIATVSADLHRDLTQLARTMQTPSEQITPQILLGNPVDVLVKESQSVDLIIMGTHSRRALQHLLLGSVAEKVIREAHCSVFIAKRR